MRLGRTGIAIVTLAALLGAAPAASPDGGSVATNVDTVAREKEKEYREILERGGTDAGARRRKILEGLAFAPCPTARRFLLTLVEKNSYPGDDRIVALDSLLVMATEGDLERLLAALAKERDPTLWQSFAESWPSRPSQAVVEWSGEKGLSTPPNEAVAACLEGLLRRPARSSDDRVEALFSKHGKAGGDGDVACRALALLLRRGGSDAKARALEAARHPDVRVRTWVVPWIAGSEPFDVEKEAALRGLLQDESATVRQSAAEHAGLSKRAGVAGSLVALVGDPRAKTRHAAAAALKAISGQDHGTDAKAWAAWLEKRDPGNPERVTLATYHGVPVASDRVLFLVDASSSMRWPEHKDVHRIDVARAELAAALPKLPPDALFNVLAYSDRVVPWKKTEVPATPENVQAAVTWSTKALAAPAGDTDLHGALDAAFAANPGFDTIYLLTDGDPTAGRYSGTRGLLAAVRARNRHRRATIHTIGLTLISEDPGRPNLTENLDVMRSLLTSLAQITGGQFREVTHAPAPPK